VASQLFTLCKGLKKGRRENISATLERNPNLLCNFGHYSLQQPATWKMQEGFVLTSDTSLSTMFLRYVLNLALHQ
jgi:hypothetical protein